MDNQDMGMRIVDTEHLRKVLSSVIDNPEAAHSLLHCIASVARWSEADGSRVVIYKDGDMSFYWEAATLNKDHWVMTYCGGINWSEPSQTYSVNS